jgi:hypothetical protein
MNSQHDRRIDLTAATRVVDIAELPTGLLRRTKLKRFALSIFAHMINMTASHALGFASRSLLYGSCAVRTSEAAGRYAA